MDHANYFDTKNTYGIVRAEYFAGFLVCGALLIAHFGEVRWAAALTLFFLIDVIGYLPGALTFRLSKDKSIHKAYYVLYNVMHNWFAAGTIAGLWTYFVKWEWALLAIPFHLCADRGLLGNYLKPFGVSFEPVRHPSYKAFTENYGRALPADRSAEDHRLAAL